MEDLIERAPEIVGALQEEAQRHPDVWLYRDAAVLIKQLTAEPPNDPLTLEELRGMDGEPVWVVLTPRRSWELTGECRIIVKWDYVDRLAHSPIGNMFASDYGKTWLAYRRKPDGGGEA